MEKKIKVVGSLNPQKVCQDKVRVFSGGGYLQSNTFNRLQSTAKGSKGMEKKIKIAGRIGNTEFQNNDSGKVLYGGV